MHEIFFEELQAKCDDEGKFWDVIIIEYSYRIIIMNCEVVYLHVA
jgi:hypothetical protein